MTKKQKIIVSTTGIFLVLLILVGLTYAYFLTRIKGNTNEKSISVSTANLILEYADIDDIVVGGENVEPGTTWTKKFSATNKGSKKVEYGVALENVLNTLENAYYGYEVRDISSAVGKYVYDTENNEISYMVSYSSKKATLKKLKVIGYEKVLNTAPDDYGTSYYYRGNVVDNYIKFAGLIWRIVRINGDGSIRILLNDTNLVSKFNNFKNGNGSEEYAYAGYMYGMTGQTSSNINQCIKYDSFNDKAVVDSSLTSEEECINQNGKWAKTGYDATFVNIVSSDMKKFLETWYKNNLNNYTQFIEDNMFCNDKTPSIDGKAIDDDMEFAVQDRNYYTNYYATPTLKCAEKSNNDYSRYTVNKYKLSNGNYTNGDLTYPIGLLNADELTFLGTYPDIPNSYTYYYNEEVTGENYKWLLSPEAFSSVPGVSVFNGYWGCNGGGAETTGDYIVQPVINLKSNVIITKGDGTENNPYEIAI